MIGDWIRGMVIPYPSRVIGLRTFALEKSSLQKYPRYRKLLAFLLGGLIGFTALGFLTSASIAQVDSPADLAQFVYQKLPNLPLENQYLRAENSKPAPESTLVSRLAQYHSLKGRSPIYRLDWKITLADYLGINDYLRLDVYPGNTFLKTNPMERDQTAIQALNRAQRNALVQALVDGATGQDSSASVAEPPPPAQTKAVLEAPYKPTLLPLPAKGSSELLKPAKKPAPKPSGDAQYLLP
jgi:hypothetical protein